jgi:hydrogenase expression/formation protein HypE
MSSNFQLSCPLPNQHPETIQLAHGGGGRMMRSLLERLFLPAFANQWLDARHDSAVVRIGAERIAFTTDTYVVSPLFFPGGDIGKLAVCGTVNDLAVSGAEPLFLTTGFVIEEGFPLKDLKTIIESMSASARRM